MIGGIIGWGVGGGYMWLFKVKGIALGTAGIGGFIWMNGKDGGWVD